MTIRSGDCERDRRSWHWKQPVDLPVPDDKELIRGACLLHQIIKRRGSAGRRDLMVVEPSGSLRGSLSVCPSMAMYCCGIISFDLDDDIVNQLHASRRNRASPGENSRSAGNSIRHHRHHRVSMPAALKLGNFWSGCYWRKRSASIHRRLPTLFPEFAKASCSFCSKPLRSSRSWASCVLIAPICSRTGVLVLHKSCLLTRLGQHRFKFFVVVIKRFALLFELLGLLARVERLACCWPRLGLAHREFARSQRAEDRAP